MNRVDLVTVPCAAATDDYDQGQAGTARQANVPLPYLEHADNCMIANLEVRAAQSA